MRLCDAERERERERERKKERKRESVILRDKRKDR